MMRKARFIQVIFCSVLTALVASAAEVEMHLNRELITLMDRAVLKVEVTGGRADEIDLPEVDGLQIQFQGQSSETRIVNGQGTSKLVYNYIVSPKRIGDYTIGPVTVETDGKKQTFRTELRVIRPKDENRAMQLSELMYSRVTTDVKEPFVHQPFTLTAKVYIRDDIEIAGSFGLQGGMPEQGLDGELTWDVQREGYEEINGAAFTVYRLQTTVKTLTAGTFVFEPAVQVNVVIPRQQRRSFGFDDPFFGDLFGRQETRPFVLESNRLELDVRPVPMQNRPNSFTGGVGEFDFDVEVGPKTVKVGEPITLKMRISGEGNLEKITPPSLENEQDYKLYDIRTVPSSAPNEVHFEQVIMPRTDSITNIPAMAFSYFNTETADFRTIRRGPFPITVEPAPQKAAQVIGTVPGAAPAETEVLGRDIVYLKPKPETWNLRSDIPWHRTIWFRLLLALPALLVVFTAFWTARRNRLAGDRALARRQKAPKAARSHLRAAEKALRQQDAGAFHEALWNALTDYFGHRLNLAPGNVSLPVVQARLADPVDGLDRLFETIEQRRYGLQADAVEKTDEMKNLLQELTRTLKQCERMKR